MDSARVIGVDVGGTKTHLRIERDSVLIADQVLPTASWWAPGTPIEHPANAAALVAAFGNPTTDHCSLVVGAHGVDSLRVAAAFAAELRRLVAGPVLVVNDAALVGPAAGYPGRVVTVVCGTGSIVLARGDAEAEVRLGGHGYLLGDEGSAPALVRDLARAVLRGVDRGEVDRVALDHLLAAAGVPASAEPEEDLAAALHQHHDITDWGRLAPAVFTAADAGSPLAREVIELHAAELVTLVGLLVARGLAPEAVVLAGGVVTAQPRLAEAIRAGVQAGHPGLPVVLLGSPPVLGAVLLARTGLDRELARSGSAEGAEQKEPVAQSLAPTEGSRS